MADHTPTRTDEIKAIHREYKFFYQVAGGSLLVAIGILIGAVAFSSDLDRSAYFIDLYTSLLSILVTVFVIDFLNRRRDERREVRQLQQQLVCDASSISNETAKNAIHQLQKRDWLEGEDGLLKRMNLENANLAEANLSSANLAEANLSSANLAEANLNLANLEGVDFSHAYLKGTILAFAHLKEAALNQANLKRANLVGAYLKGATLIQANLNGADLSEAHLDGAKIGKGWYMVSMDETTILPDGSHWTPATDLTQFGCIIE
jgi:hypothetical protein